MDTAGGVEPRPYTDPVGARLVRARSASGLMHIKARRVRLR
jgi:hypothetical protein